MERTAIAYESQQVRLSVENDRNRNDLGSDHGAVFSDKANFQRLVHATRCQELADALDDDGTESGGTNSMIGRPTSDAEGELSRPAAKAFRKRNFSGV